MMMLVTWIELWPGLSKSVFLFKSFKLFPSVFWTSFFVLLEKNKRFARKT